MRSARAGLSCLTCLLVGACSPELAPSTPPTETRPLASEPHAAQAGLRSPPPTPRRPVVDHYHGQSVVDPYRWLEAKGSEEVRRWVDAQNRYTRSVLDALPGRADIERRVTQVYSVEHPRYGWVEVAGGRWFVLVDRPPAQQPMVVVMEAGDDPVGAKLLVDPNRLDPTGKTTIDCSCRRPTGAAWRCRSPRGGRSPGT